jgi:hypothetical protein
MAAAARLGTMATFANSPGNAMLPASSFALCRCCCSPWSPILLVFTVPSEAAETARRLQVDLEVRRDGAVRKAPSRAAASSCSS